MNGFKWRCDCYKVIINIYASVRQWGGNIEVAEEHTLCFSKIYLQISGPPLRVGWTGDVVYILQAFISFTK